MTGTAASRFGRYEVLGLIPSADDGETFMAIDQKHGRRVALRVVAIGALQTEALGAFTRQIRALARVRHPSLPIVYDVGADDAELFIAEEAVIGSTLDAWLSAKRRSWREIARVFVSVASAISAIHNAGLVCRELRPSGVLITKDGRVVVTNVGLHRPLGTGPASYGTPEETSERPGDARTDQLALCALFHASLFGLPAFRIGESDAPTFELTDTANASPSIPASLRALLDRGLARDPAQRFVSLGVLASTLQGIVDHRRYAPRLAVASLAGAVIALCTGAVAGAWIRAGTPFASIAERRAEACKRVEPTLDGVWDLARDHELRRALWRAARADSGTDWELVRRRLDAWSAEWRRLHMVACDASVAATATELLAAQATLSCLAETRRHVAALLDAVPELGVRRTIIASTTMGPPGECPPWTPGEWIDGLRKGVVPSSMSTEHALELRAAYAWVEGNLDLAIERMQAAVAARPEESATADLANALGNLGTLLAEAGRDDEALAAVRRAIRVRERLNASPSLDLARLYQDLGTLLGRQKATVDALAAHRHALDIKESVVGPETLEAAASRRAIGRLERDAGRYAESVTSYRRALALRTTLLGEESGEAAVSNVELGWALLAANKPGEASERFLMAENVGQRVMGRASRLVARALEGHGVTDIMRGQPAKAIAPLEEALTTLERTGSDPDQIARTRFYLATALMNANVDQDRARRLALAARDRLVADGAPASPELETVKAWLARTGGGTP